LKSLLQHILIATMKGASRAKAAHTQIARGRRRIFWIFAKTRVARIAHRRLATTIIQRLWRTPKS
jgi:hypothetical protein